MRLERKQLIYDFLAGNNYPDLPHLQGGMKFATQISPVLNCKFKNLKQQSELPYL